MSGFSNAVVGGVGKLVRKWIQSPDYAQGISGWTVNQDGSAEFNDVTIRGIVVIEGSSGELFAYRGTPGLGTLVCAIAGQSGSDSYGNVYQEGITLPSSLTGNPVGQIAFADSLSTAAVARSPFMADFTVAGVSSDLKIKGATDDIINHQPASIDLMFGIAPNPPWTVAQIIGDRVQLAARNGGNGQIELVGPVQVGAGRIGEYHYEEWDITNGYSIPNAAITALSGIANITRTELFSDYGAGFDPASGLFTPPVDGIYHISGTVGFATWVANSRYFLSIRNVNSSYAGSDFVCGALAHALGSFSLDVFLTTNQPLQVVVYQNTGTARPIENSATIRSFLSFRRVL